MHGSKTFGRNTALSAVSQAWQESAGGSPRLVLLEGPDGSGRSHLVSQAIASTPNTFPLRLDFQEGEDGLRVLLRLYASLFTTLHDSPSLMASVKEKTDALLATAQEPQKQWLMAFKEGLDKPRPDTSAASFQVTIPRSSPYLALQEMLALFAPSHPVLLELGNVDHVLSFAFWSFLTALVDRVRFQKLPIMVVLTAAAKGQDEKDALPFQPLAAFLGQLHPELMVEKQTLEPLSAEALEALVSDSLGTHRLAPEVLQGLHDAAHGWPGMALDVLTLLKDRALIVEADDDAWVASDAALGFTASELLPELPAGKETLARQALQVAALEGALFTGTVISEQLDTDKDTIDDLLDDLDEIVEEVVHHEGLNTWLYRFKNAGLRELCLRDLSDAARVELARGLGGLLEKKYVNASPDYAVKAARLWRLAGDSKRAMNLIGLAASAERPEILQMGAEVIKAFTDTTFAPPIYKGLHLTLFEKAVQAAPPEMMMVLLDDTSKWATDRNDGEMLAWLTLYRARTFLRMGQGKEAEKAADAAQRAFAKAENAVKEADALNVLGQLALARGEMGVAKEFATRAASKTSFPPIKVQTQFILGLVHKNRGELQEALDQLKESLDLSGKLGIMPIHLDSGLNIAEILLMGGKAPEAVGLLNQLAQAAQNAGQPPRLRAAFSLLGKAHATLRDMPKATECASNALRISRELKAKPFEAADLLDMGIFSFVKGSLDEAAVFLRESEKLGRELKDKRLLKEVLFHHGMVFSGMKDYTRSQKAYQEALAVTKELKDERREANILFNLGGIFLHQGEFAKARTWLDQAAPLLERFGSAEEKKALAKAREQIQQKMN